MKRIFRYWLVLAVILSILFATAYITMQQISRTSYDWPQISAVNEVSYVLQNKKPTGAIMDRYRAPAPIDRSDATFVIIYNQDGKIISSGAELEGSSLTAPIEVLSSSDPAPAYRPFTWAPTSKIRIAAVVQKVNIDDKTNYILAGRNLKQPEYLTQYVLFLMSMGWLASLIGSLVCMAIILPKSRR